jgi:pyruvate dehydrogenase E2 component (dihydrolipoamide acetyltransferase)
MPFDVLLPQWGMGMNDGLVIKWLKQEGDAVTKGEPLVEIESSKVNSEVESPGDGTLARIVVPEGMTVDVGVRLAVVLADGETADLPEPMSASQAPAASPTAGPTAPPTPTPQSAAPAAAPPTAAGGRRQVTPIARRIAGELGVDVDSVSGTGPGGRVTEKDVRVAAEAGPAPTAAGVGPPVGKPVQLTGLRGAIARRMGESAAIPQVTLTTEVDVTATSELMSQLLRDWRSHRLRPQFQDLVLKAVARALTEHPRANSHLVDGEVREIASVNLGFALAVPDGLLVPVVQEADGKSILEIAQHVRDIAKRVREGHQTVEDLSWGTFTVTGLGSFGVDAFNPLLNPPEVGILGFGRIVQKPAVVDGEITVRSMLWLSLTFDHRAWDGAPAGEFLHAVSSHLSDPGWMVD